MFRPFAALTLGLLATACGSPTVPNDAGFDAGVADGGFDAGPAPICLADEIDAGAPSDAGWDGGYDFACRGRAREAGGQAELLISGFVSRAGFTRTPMGGVQVELFRVDGGRLATTTSSDDGGLYRVAFDAGCARVDGELRATHVAADAGFYVTWSVPSSPWTRDRSGLELILFDEQTSTLVAALAGVTVVDGGAVLALNVSDCGGNNVEGAVVSTAGSVGTVRYVGASGLPSNSATSTSARGDVLIFNLPGTAVDITATLDGGAIGQRVVPIHPGAVTGTTLFPY